MLKTFEIVIPAYNEEQIIETNLRRVYQSLEQTFPHAPWILTLANNSSDDQTGEIGRALMNQRPNLQVRDVWPKGKGQAIYQSWKASDADVVAFLDADLAVPPDEIKKLIIPMQEGFQAVIGCRHIPGAQVQREFVRQLTSYGYNKIVNLILKTPYHDHQCGFKAMNRQLFLSIEPLLEERQWFFDTELLYLLHRKSIAVIEVPVIWQDQSNRPSRVTSLNNNIRQGLHLVRRLKKRRLSFD